MDELFALLSVVKDGAVTAADASSFRASQGQIAADMARAIDRASRNR